MSTLVLLEENSPPAGFLLFAGDEPVVPGSTRECLFMVLPLPATSQAALAIAERKHEEFEVSIASVGDELHIAGECRPGELLDIRMPSEKRGGWSLTIGAQRHSGACEWAGR